VSEGILPTDESAGRVIMEAHNILSQCSPASGPAVQRAGLVCGYVQSGKTASMTAVSALARDNGFRIVILIGGVTTNLVSQNRDRLETQLRASATEWSWLMMTNPHIRSDLAEVEALVQEWRSEHYTDQDRRTLLISVMKNHSHLRNLAQLLSSLDLTDIPALVFDDEADQASLNTRPNDPNPSTTYVTIGTLRDALPHHTYLQYTATPQAPLLITRIDSLSADFAELVTPGAGYTGGDDFFEPAANPHSAVIPDDEVFVDGALPIEPPRSLMRGLQVFFVGVAAGRLGMPTTHRSMLIHPSKATATHRHYYDWANNLKSFWHSVLVGADNQDKRELVGEFRAAFTDLARTVDGIPPFDEIESRLPVAINQTAITLVNSVGGREVPWQNGYSHILVGGEKLGRGYTVKGLTVTYMPRSPGGWTADTIQQRARFFGYHNAYFGYCRVYLHPDVRGVYLAYLRHEADMRDRLQEHRGRPLREWRRLFYLDQHLAPTRKNVLSSPYDRPHLSDGWFAPHAPHVAPRDGRDNLALVRRLEALTYAPHARYEQHQSAVVYLRDVFEQVLAPLSYLERQDSLGLCVVNCSLKTILDLNNDSRCVIYLMDRGRQRVRTLTNGLIPQLFQGRSSAGADSYPGDRYFSDQDLTTIQVHMLRVQGDGWALENVAAVAVRLGYQEDILVHDE
jgi:Z1 domain